MFDAVNLEDVHVMVEDTGETELADTEFVERAARKRLEEVTGFSPL